MNSKRGFEFNFAWIFAIIVGAIIIFIAIYASNRIIGVGSYQLNAITAKQLSIIFEPLETGLASGISPSPVLLKEDTIIYNSCDEKGNFGRQKISVAAAYIKDKEKGPELSVPNKYIFSNNSEQGKKIYYFAKTFEMPFKVSEIIFLTTKRYCFVNAPDSIMEEASYLMANLDSNCTKDSIKVCFQTGNCEIKVQGTCSDCESKYDSGIISKNGKNLYYTGSLMYAAIYSSPDIYECNVKRLAKRLSQQALLLKEESDFLTGECESASTSLISLAASAESFSKSSDLSLVYENAKDAERENDAGECKLW